MAIKFSGELRKLRIVAHMFKYAVRTKIDWAAVTVSLVDWPEVSTVVRKDPVAELRGVLLRAIAGRVRSREPVPLPKAKPCAEFFVPLSSREAMKVMTFNEMIQARLGMEDVALRLSVSHQLIRQMLDLDHPADLDLIERVMNLAGKRIVAYPVSS
ncbi:hypothetical protein ABB26_02960 [Stenotrophomonas humi]|uniref:Uncharacterized protein n=1 Tax=Stenotrophomonas humi TaxID=405444 RepID=A0A0R0C912_9GAMM|nr:hypothetical protein [Stenotrophomonas humi]KRG65526.1 hypothetical protein ABB26_02960 [Stenotrophomonas humi]